MPVRNWYLTYQGLPFLLKTPGLELTFVSANGRKEIDGILVVLKRYGPQHHLGTP